VPIALTGGTSGGGGSGTVTDVSSADTSIVVTNGTTTPSLQLATLDVIATNEPAAAAVDVNSQKITGLAPGAASGEAATWDQTSAPFAPTGTTAVFTRHGNSFANGAALTSGDVECVSTVFAAGLTITSITFYSAATPASTPTHQIFGLYDAAGNLLRATSDDTSTSWAMTTAKTLNLTSPFTTTYTGIYYLAILVVAGTVPSLVVTAQSANAIYVTALAPSVYGCGATGVTAMPATITLPLNTVGTVRISCPYCVVA
jgi:hypothetical protein